MPATELNQQLVGMGQELFAPPNVKGWDGEKKWINASTWAARAAFAERVAGLVSDNEFGPHLDVTKLVPADVNDPLKVVELLADRLLEDALAAEKREEMAKFLVTTEAGDMAAQFRDDAAFREQQVRALLGVVLSLPEFHAY